RICAVHHRFGFYASFDAPCCFVSSRYRFRVRSVTLLTIGLLATGIDGSASDRSASSRPLRFVPVFSSECPRAHRMSADLVKLPFFDSGERMVLAAPSNFNGKSRGT